MPEKLRYYILYKPYRVLCQFSPSPGKLTLADVLRVPEDVYPVGRLDYESEGLLLLTNDKRLHTQLLHPHFAHPRAYWVQVEGEITPEAIVPLYQGIVIRIKRKTYRTLPLPVDAIQLLNEPPPVPERHPPIRYRRHIPTSWISIRLYEGKYHQIRKMMAATGYPVLRLIRYAIGQLQLGSMKPGEYREIAYQQAWLALQT
ncbi:MAG: pseudouridine synthase [Thermoflavifilum sp.]|uniref:pseudouridine synthase n=1 Tax=Thermoflavifilum sp. TaxID=1968839 RepID=UPI0018A5230E|nr:pseudouridine synthase [Thermoflavifilum sp.]QOR76570.1 MAG: pseudouridine synthase [Thermoflavifilum sp.]